MKIKKKTFIKVKTFLCKRIADLWIIYMCSHNVWLYFQLIFRRAFLSLSRALIFFVVFLFVSSICSPTDDVDGLCKLYSIIINYNYLIIQLVTSVDRASITQLLFYKMYAHINIKRRLNTSKSIDQWIKLVFKTWNIRISSRVCVYVVGAWVCIQCGL